jgi:hypothetical protein
MTVLWDIAPCSLGVALMMEAVSTSKTSVNPYPGEISGSHGGEYDDDCLRSKHL